MRYAGSQGNQHLQWPTPLRSGQPNPGFPAKSACVSTRFWPTVQKSIFARPENGKRQRVAPRPLRAKNSAPTCDQSAQPSAIMYKASPARWMRNCLDLHFQRQEHSQHAHYIFDTFPSSSPLAASDPCWPSRTYGCVTPYTVPHLIENKTTRWQAKPGASPTQSGRSIVLRSSDCTMTRTSRKKQSASTCARHTTLLLRKCRAWSNHTPHNADRATHDLRKWQYERQFEKWKVKKNHSPATWNKLRGSSSTSSPITYHGRVIAVKKAKKAMARYKGSATSDGE